MIVAFPVPPTIESLPDDVPKMMSLPPPPVIVSFPVPPTIESLPDDVPKMMSLPPPPVIVALPVPPTIESLPDDVAKDDVITAAARDRGVPSPAHDRVVARSTCQR